LVVLITGGSGFIGSNVCEFYARSNQRIVSFDLNPFDFDESDARNITFRKGDVTNFQDLSAVVKEEQVDGIISAAAIVGADPVPLRALAVNCVGTANALECARLLDVKRVVYVSSNSVYGIRKDLLPVKEDDSPNTVRVYESLKLMGEQICRIYKNNYGIEVIIVRPSIVYGPRSVYSHPPNMVMKILSSAISGKSFHLSGGAGDHLDYVYVKDVARGIALVQSQSKLAYDRYNIASGFSPSPIEIAEIVKGIFPNFEYVIGSGFSQQGGGWIQGPLDISRASADLSYVPTSMKDAILDYSTWLKNHPDEKRLLEQRASAS